MEGWLHTKLRYEIWHQQVHLVQNSSSLDWTSDMGNKSFEKLKLKLCIVGMYGSSVGSLFYYARWMFCLNLFLATLWIFFVLIPQAVHFDYSMVNKSMSVMNVYDFKVGSFHCLFFMCKRSTHDDYLCLIHDLLFVWSYFWICFLTGTSWADVSALRQLSVTCWSLCGLVCSFHVHMHHIFLKCLCHSSQVRIHQ